MPTGHASRVTARAVSSPWLRPAAQTAARLGDNYRLLVWFTLCLAAFNQNYQMFACAVLIPNLLHELGLSYTLAGTLLAAGTLSMAAMMAPAGVLSDKLGGRRLITLGLAGMCLGALLFTVADSFPLAFAGRVLIGAGTAAVMVPPAQLMAFWFRPREYRLAYGLHVSLGKTGSVFATWLLPPLVVALGWRLGYGAASLIGPLALLCAWLFVVNRPDDVGLRHPRRDTPVRQAAGLPADRVASTTAAPNPLVITRSPGLMALAAANFFYFGAYFGVANWLPTFIVQTRGLSEVEAGFQAGFLIWGTIVGFALSGPAANCLGRCCPLYRAGITATGVCTVLLITVLPHLPAWTWPPVLLIHGIGISGNILTISILTTIVPRAALATATGIVLTVSFMGAMALPPLVGAVADATGSLAGSFWLAVGACLIALALSAFMREGGIEPDRPTRARA